MMSYPDLLHLVALAAILNTSPSSLETRDLVCARVLSRRHIEKREDPGDEVGFKPLKITTGDDMEYHITEKE